MAFTLGNTSRLLANGRVITSTVAGYTISMSRPGSEVTTMTDSGSRFIPGVASGTMALRGPQDSTGQSLHSQVAAAVGVDNSLILTICPNGNSAGNLSYSCVGDLQDWAVDSSVSEAVTYALTTAADEMVDVGFVLHGLGPETANGNTTAIDRGAGTTGGGAAIIHITAYSGFTNIVAKVQHSTDNSTWTDLATFATVTAIGAQRLFLPAGTAVNRYVRASLTVTGTGSVTYLVALEPR